MEREPIVARGGLLWRGSLLPLECEALPGFWGRCAAQREQAPSPQVQRHFWDW